MELTTIGELNELLKRSKKNLKPYFQRLIEKSERGGQVRNLWRDLITENIGLLKEDFKGLKPKERLAISVKMSNFILPRLQSIESSNYPDWAELLELTPEERAQEILKLKREIDNNEKTGPA